MLQLPDPPDIARCLRTGYPAPLRRVAKSAIAVEVDDEEFAAIVLGRTKKESEKTDSQKGFKNA